MVTLQGRPDNIKRTPFGDFWVAVTVQRSVGTTLTNLATAVRINAEVKILVTQALGPQYENTTISEVLQYGASRYIGSFDAHFLGVYY